MMKNIMLMAIALLLIPVSPLIADNNTSGYIVFSGKVLETSCVVTVSSQNDDLNIYLSPVSIYEIQQYPPNSLVKKQSFRIYLSNCLSGNTAKVKVFWDKALISTDNPMVDSDYFYLPGQAMKGEPKNIYAVIIMPKKDFLDSRETVVPADNHPTQPNDRWVSTYYFGYLSPEPLKVKSKILKNYVHYRITYN